MPADFHRYRRTVGWNTAINQRQFGLPVAAWEFPSDFRDPDVTYREELTFRRGDLAFELHHSLGETDDATWTWLPDRRILHAGDLFIWAVPNAGNPQKVQRYAGEWAAALREMAGLGAEVLWPGTGRRSSAATASAGR
jgi:glyoxylase-like metal-dependent hydrolase (beta-lactamase superfamily II)